MKNFTKSRAFFPVALIAGVAFLQACTPEGGDYMETVALGPEPVAVAATSTNTRTCGANAMGWLIGQPETTLAAVTINGPVRVVAAGQSVSMGDPSRLNVNMDVDGRIASLTCG